VDLNIVRVQVGNKPAGEYSSGNPSLLYLFKIKKKKKRVVFLIRVQTLPRN
jgi:hypothetical protein